MTTETLTKAVTQTDPAVARMQDMLSQYKGHMAALLGKHMSVEQMFQIALLALGRVPKLKECTTASVLGCILESTRLHLQAGAGAGETWLIPRKNKHTGKMECTLVVDYRAIIKMMKRDAGVKTVFAEVVRERDVFDYGISSGKLNLNWRPALGDRGPVVGYFAASWDAEEKLTGIIFKTKAEIDESCKAKSTAADSGPWKTDPDWMYKKSVIRPLAKLNPGTASELSRAVMLDDRAELGLPQNLHLLADPTAAPDPENGAEPYQPPKRASEGTAPAKPEDAKPVEVKEGAEFFTVVFRVGSVSKTEKDGKTVHVLRSDPDEDKFFTEHDAVANLGRSLAGKGKISVTCEYRSKERWVLEAEAIKDKN